MNDVDELTGGPSGTATTQAQRPPADYRGDDAGQAPAAVRMRTGNGQRARAGEAQLVTGEETGDARGGEAFAGPGDLYAEQVSPAPGGESFVEASIEQLEHAEAGEESATTDLQEFGYTPIARGESDAVSPVGEAGAVDAAENRDAEFFPILAALVPTLVSTIGPAVAKGVMSRLSPRAKGHITRIAKTAVTTAAAARPPFAPTAAAATAAISAASKAGGRSALLAMLARLLTSAAAKPGGESGMEASDPVVEQATQVLEVIIGSDDRVQIKGTNGIPWRYLCALSGVFPDGARYTGTAFLIGPRTAATAGHCVYSHGHGGWARSLEVIPGADGSQRPYGQAQAVSFRSTAGWVNSKNAQSDIGCVVLPPGGFSGRNLGHFGFGVWETKALLALPAVLTGFPGDKPFAEMWGMSRLIKSASATTLIYDIDTYGGQSGAPVYIKRNGQRYVVGIHNYGAATGNSATRVTQPIYALLSAWAKI
jgi:glutamyl endopeptidase